MGSRVEATPARPRVRGRRDWGPRERAERGRSAREAPVACCPARPRPARHRPENRDAPPNPELSRKPGRILGGPRAPARRASGPCPTPIVHFGVRAWPPPACRRSALQPHPRGQRGEPGRGRASWTEKGGGVLAGPGHLPKYTVLSHLGHLEAMVDARPFSPCPPPAPVSPPPPPPPPRPPRQPRPTGCPCSHWSASGAGRQEPAPGVRAPRGRGRTCRGGWGATGPAGRPWVARARWPLPRPALSSPVSMATSGEPAGPRVGLGVRGPLDWGRPGQRGLGPEGRRRDKQTDSPTADRPALPGPGARVPKGTVPHPAARRRPASLCCSVSIATALRWDRSGIPGGRATGPGPVPAPPNTVSGAEGPAGGGQGARHFQKQRERNCWKGVGEGVPGSEGTRGAVLQALKLSSPSSPTRGR